MNYQKLWNDLKDEMVRATELESSPGSNYEEYLFHASTLLRRMVRAEVEECRQAIEKESDLDLKLAEMLFAQKGE